MVGDGWLTCFNCLIAPCRSDFRPHSTRFSWKQDCLNATSHKVNRADQSIKGNWGNPAERTDAFCPRLLAKTRNRSQTQQAEQNHSTSWRLNRVESCWSITGPISQQHHPLHLFVCPCWCLQGATCCFTRWHLESLDQEERTPEIVIKEFTVTP